MSTIEELNDAMGVVGGTESTKAWVEKLGLDLDKMSIEDASDAITTAFQQQLKRPWTNEERRIIQFSNDTGRDY